MRQVLPNVVARDRVAEIACIGRGGVSVALNRVCQLKALNGKGMAEQARTGKEINNNGS
jgi:hypothetical protein